MPSEFDKNMLAKNISHLVKERNMKMGDFENKAGVSTGYVSRIIREDAIKPNAEFIVNAANILEVSLDTLLNTNLSELTSTEHYFKNFIDKLISDTREDKLEWKVERKSYLNSILVCENGTSNHPLFDGEVTGNCLSSGYPEPIYSEAAYFNSNVYGTDTIIDDDCFHANIGSNTQLYVMHYRKSDEEAVPLNIGAIELWFVQNARLRSFVGGTLTFPNLAEDIAGLYREIKEYMKTPHLPKAVKSVIDSYLTPTKNTTQAPQSSGNGKLTAPGASYQQATYNNDDSDIPF